MRAQLGWLQVAALLVSASYGIGFLFGSGEAAVSQGMAGALYPWVTGAAMLLLALISPRIRELGLPVWDLCARSGGPAVRRQIALLSLVWMAGVLAAQIQGGAAILTLAGVPRVVAIAIVALLIYCASRIRLGFASTLFSLCLLGSSVVLIFALYEMNGLQAYFHAPEMFMRDVRLVDSTDIAITTIGVAFLVVTGADYQQFVMAARRPADARWGCVLAAAFLLAVGALPALTVVSARNAHALAGMTAHSEAIPFVLTHWISRGASAGWNAAMLVPLLAAALGSGAAIVRAMTDALAASLPARTQLGPRYLAAGVLLPGVIVALGAQGIVATMVGLNLVYIASVAPVFLMELRRVALDSGAARASLAAGFLTSSALYVGEWFGLFGVRAALLSLLIGLGASTLTLLAHRHLRARMI